MPQSCCRYGCSAMSVSLGGRKEQAVSVLMLWNPWALRNDQQPDKCFWFSLFFCDVNLKLCSMDNTSVVWKQLGVMQHMEEIAFFCLYLLNAVSNFLISKGAAGGKVQSASSEMPLKLCLFLEGEIEDTSSSCGYMWGQVWVVQFPSAVEGRYYENVLRPRCAPKMVSHRMLLEGCHRLWSSEVVVQTYWRNEMGSTFNKCRRSALSCFSWRGVASLFVMLSSNTVDRIWKCNWTPLFNLVLLCLCLHADKEAWPLGQQATGQLRYPSAAWFNASLSFLGWCGL